ncbi:hypothetical protein [Pseudomonas sp. FME51]|uniref:hypothetical protein n=1 Tax=Pseudomonas sp. FME51 TaxID=2742609 RepID=UPI0018661332|nr:hypothetical protein [Pseudomonas sp. FME51]
MVGQYKGNSNSIDSDTGLPRCIIKKPSHKIVSGLIKTGTNTVESPQTPLSGLKQADKTYPVPVSSKGARQVNIICTIHMAVCRSRFVIAIGPADHGNGSSEL